MTKLFTILLACGLISINVRAQVSNEQEIGNATSQSSKYNNNSNNVLFGYKIAINLLSILMR